MGIPWQPGCASDLPKCWLPNGGACFKGKKSSVPKCWLRFVCLLDFHLFLNTSARNSFALLFPAHRWQSIIAWCEHFQYSSFFLAKYSNRGRGNRLMLVLVPLCFCFFAEWGNGVGFFVWLVFCLVFFAIFCHIVLNCHSMLRKNRLILISPLATRCVVIVLCESLNPFPSW